MLMGMKRECGVCGLDTVSVVSFGGCYKEWVPGRHAYGCSPEATAAPPRGPKTQPQGLQPLRGHFRNGCEHTGAAHSNADKPLKLIGTREQTDGGQIDWIITM